MQVSRGWLNEFRVANNTLMSKCNNLSLSTLQRARKELIDNNYIMYRKGKNQNDASRYSIVKLYEENMFEQADEQALEQAEGQADEQAVKHIITKLNNYYKYIKREREEFENISEEDRKILIRDSEQLRSIYKSRYTHTKTSRRNVGKSRTTREI